MKNRYLLQVCRDKLTDYIMKAIISPDTLMGDECHIDTQSKYKHVLLLSKGIINNLDKFEEILIEIVLNKKEIEKNLMPTDKDDIFYISTPLPISRIVKIYTRDYEESTHILKKIETNQKGFIPTHLIEVKIDFKSFDIPIINKNIFITEFQNKLIKYDKILGMLSFMKNFEYYYADSNQKISNFPTGYCDSIATMNTIFPSSESTFMQDLKNDDDTGFFNFLMENKRLGKSFIENLLKKDHIPRNIQKYLSQLINDPLKKLEILQALKEKEGIYFYLCLVYINSDKYSNKMSNFKCMFHKHIPYEKAQKALGYLGLYYGYELLDANEEIEIKDQYFKQYLTKNNIIHTKFSLENKFDFMVIESVYQYVFQTKVIDDLFSYLAHIRITTEKNSIPSNEWYKKRVLNHCIDIKHFSIKKRTQEEYIAYKILKQYKSEIHPNQYVSAFYNKYCSLMPVNTLVKREDLLQNITTLTKIQQKEILDVIQMDRRYV